MEGFLAGGPACTAASTGSVVGHGFLYCGYHWASWPISFTVDAPPAGVGVSASQFTTAVRAAANEWNNAWSVLGGGGHVPFAYTTSTSAPVHVGYSAHGALPAGTPGRTSSDFVGKVYFHSTVSLNVDESWKIANAMEQVAGEIQQFAGKACLAVNSSCDWYDVQDIATHELGHVIGLEHPGNQGSCFSGSLTEGIDVGETMYWCAYYTETYKRSLDWGDILGLERVGQDSA